MKKNKEQTYLFRDGFIGKRQKDKELKGNQYAENDLKHFGINEDELKSAQLFRCKNSAFFREKTGVNLAIGECERLSGNVAKKVRIIIDYDADFPNIITRVIFQ